MSKTKNTKSIKSSSPRGDEEYLDCYDLGGVVRTDLKVVH